jgi:hypothetical protein
MHLGLGGVQSKSFEMIFGVQLKIIAVVAGLSVLRCV